MNTTAQHVLTGTPTQRPDARHGLPRAWLITLIALTVLTGATVAWQASAFTNAAPASHTRGVADPGAANRPGGSVYEEQVPKGAPDQWAASHPGGSIYDQQVPKAAGGPSAPVRPDRSTHDR